MGVTIGDLARVLRAAMDALGSIMTAELLSGLLEEEQRDSLFTELCDTLASVDYSL